ncbi:Phosphopantetheine binding ACP domain [Dillenia turbinata]|uniref:Acyl carrier protein n=1 Tax=Dillenia turbinata TaxID=194707 RepID=A0AAN8UUJ4_9MAGN
MQRITSSALRHVRLQAPERGWSIPKDSFGLNRVSLLMYMSTVSNHDQVLEQVIKLVKEFDTIDASKVTEKADFQKDLNLDSLDRVELVMAIEQQFSIEIPDEKADKLTCCADVANYIISEADKKDAEKS